MSWNKNTVNQSQIGTTIETLKDVGIPFTLSVIGEVRGCGLNDTYLGVNTHPIRRLQYENFVILEQMERHTDCDCDDVICSDKFILEEEPKDWDLEYTIDDYDQYEDA